jgi:hypothetical protein
MMGDGCGAESVGGRGRRGRDTPRGHQLPTLAPRQRCMPSMLTWMVRYATAAPTPAPAAARAGVSGAPREAGACFCAPPPRQHVMRLGGRASRQPSAGQRRTGDGAWHRQGQEVSSRERRQGLAHASITAAHLQRRSDSGLDEPLKRAPREHVATAQRHAIPHGDILHEDLESSSGVKKGRRRQGIGHGPSIQSTDGVRKRQHTLSAARPTGSKNVVAATPSRPVDATPRRAGLTPTDSRTFSGASV